MKKNVIVSLADANYFPLLDELVDSIKRFKESENIAICVLDAGLTQKQKEKFLNLYSLSLLHSFVKSILACEQTFPQKFAIFQDSIHFFKLYSDEKLKGKIFSNKDV